MNARVDVLNAGSNVFVTGATGLIGGELVRALVQQPVGKVWTLIRPSPDADPATRLVQRLRRSGAGEGTLGVHAVAGDVRLPHLGLAADDLDEIQRDADIIIHSAAETSFIRAAACRQTNIAGAQNLIEFARSARRRPLLVCLSTAYVSGAVANVCLSETSGLGDAHHNEYTRSKAVAEDLFRSSGLPVLVVRPSIVLSAGLPDEQFARAILGFLPWSTVFEAVPIDPAARADTVPVQFVVQSIVRLLQVPRRKHDCYHISAGTQGSACYAEFSAVVDRFYGRARPLQLIHPSQWTRELHRRCIATPQQRRVFGQLRNYLPFLNMNVLYDNARLREELGDKFPELPPLASYFGELLALMAKPRLTAAS
ncbi:MAG: SDR family oxidoreductase [Phycisphaerae bacterium]|nr:SDR family oxidoreductase [Phycisphaerae bacterium]